MAKCELKQESRDAAVCRWSCGWSSKWLVVVCLVLVENGRMAQADNQVGAPEGPTSKVEAARRIAAIKARLDEAEVQALERDIQKQLKTAHGNLHTLEGPKSGHSNDEIQHAAPGWYTTGHSLVQQARQEDKERQAAYHAALLRQQQAVAELSGGAAKSNAGGRGRSALLSNGIGEKIEESHFSEEAEALREAEARERRFEAGLKELKGPGIFGSKYLTQAGSEDKARQQEFHKELNFFGPQHTESGHKKQQGKQRTRLKK